LQWGLIPSWANDPKIGNRLINARAESASDKPAFRAAFRRRRCLIPTDGFYEWLKKGSQKQPYLIRMRDGQPFAFAGLWEFWHGQNEREIESFTILTTEPNELAAQIHNRMPAILNPDDYQAWLDPDEQDVEKLKGLLKPAPAQAMVAYPVSKRVNSPAIDDPACIAPSKESKANNSLFGT
jgi:putative SOS response-associated peptidase YedK